MPPFPTLLLPARRWAAKKAVSKVLKDSGATGGREVRGVRGAELHPVPHTRHTTADDAAPPLCLLLARSF